MRINVISTGARNERNGEISHNTESTRKDFSTPVVPPCGRNDSTTRSLIQMEGGLWVRALRLRFNHRLLRTLEADLTMGTVAERF